MRLKVIAIALLVVLVSILYSVPSLIGKNASYFPVAKDWDGTFYTMRLKAALTKEDPNLSCVEDYSLRSDKTWMPSTIENLWAAILRPFVGTDIFQAVRMNYIILPSLIFLLLFMAIFFLIQNYYLALIIAFWGVTEPNIYYWKFISWPFSDYYGYLPFLRFANPLLKSIPMLGSLACCFWLIHWLQSKKEKAFIPVCIAALLLGFTFYTQSFYWSWSWGTLFLLCVYFYYTKQKIYFQSIGIVCFVSILIGFPNVWKNLQLAQDPFIIEVLNRVGLLIENRSPHTVVHKSMLFTFLLYQVLSYKKYDWRWFFFSAGTLVGYFGLNQNVVTGIYNQDHHYFRPLTIFYVLFVAEILRRLIDLFGEKLSSLNLRFTYLFIFTLLIGKAAYFSYRNLEYQNNSNHINLVAKKYHESFKVLDELSKKEKNMSVLIHPHYIYNVTLLSDASVFVHSYTHQCMIHNNDFYNRWLLLFRAFGFDESRYKSYLDDSLKLFTLPWWMNGLPDTYKGPLNINSPKILEDYAKENLKEFSQRDLAYLVKHNSHLPNYIMEIENYRLDQEGLQQYFQLQKVYQNDSEGATIWKLNPVQR